MAENIDIDEIYSVGYEIDAIQMPWLVYMFIIKIPFINE